MNFFNRRGTADTSGILLVLLAMFALIGCGGGGGSVAVQSIDLDGDGIPDFRDNDLDGDGRINQFDDDVDGDGFLNTFDNDIDGDGIPNLDDESPYGPWIPAAQTLFVTSGVATVSFGDVPEGQLAGPAEITIQNDSISPVTVTSVVLDGSGGGAFSLDLSGLPGGAFTLPAGGQATFTASFAPTAGTPALGRVLVGLRIGGQDFSGVVHLLGMGSSPALLTSGAPTSINFGDVPVGITAGPGVATIRNDTSAVYTISRIELTGTGGGTFALDLAPVPGGAVPFDIAPGEEASFHVRFTPQQGVPSIGEVMLDMSGGTAAHTLGLDLLGQGMAPAMVVTPDEADFGTALAGVEVLELPVSIRNAGFANGDLTVSSIDFPNDAGGEMTLVTDPTPFTLSPGDAPVVLTVRFAPGAASLGARTGQMRINGNDPVITIEHLVDLGGTGAGWIAPASTIASDLTVAAGAEAPEPTHLVGSSLTVVRSAGADGVWGGALGADDQVVVIDADPDGDADTNDARVLVRWSGFALSPTPSGVIVDAGNGRHVFFVEGGIDGALGGADDQLYVLDVLSGTNRALACPNVGDRKSRPVIADATSSRVVVATGVGGGPLPGADTLLVYENLLGDVNAVGPAETVALETVVPDVLCCVPVAVNATTVVMPIADGSDNPDLDDRELHNGNEGVVRVQDLGTGAVADHFELLRALAETALPADGDAFCRPVVVAADSIALATEGVDASSTGDDELVRIDGVTTGAMSIGATRAVQDLSGAGSQPIALGGGFFALAAPGVDGVYGTTDDALLRFEAVGTTALSSFGPGESLAGAGGVGTQPTVFGADILIATGGPNGVVGDADDRVLQLDVTTLGAGSIRSTLPVEGGVFVGDRLTATSLATPRILDGRFIAIGERGVDALEATADDRLRIFRDRDQDGAFDVAGDDLDLSGIHDRDDAVTLPLANALAAQTPIISLGDGHLLTIDSGGDAALGGGDDVPVIWWLREHATLP